MIFLKMKNINEKNSEKNRFKGAGVVPIKVS
jgi:hypothetical protein